MNFSISPVSYSFWRPLSLFLFGMKVMSEGIQKLAGDKMRSILGAMTSNRFLGVLTGFSYYNTCTIFFSIYCYAGKLCKCRAPEPCSIRWGNYGGKYWNYNHCLVNIHFRV
jgi:hypothetical protein